MILGLTGLREITPFRLVRAAGILFRNANLTQLRASGLSAAINSANTWSAPNGLTVTPGAMGATIGGSEVDPKMAMSRVTFDDVRVPLMGLDQVDDSEPMFNLNVTEIADEDTLKMGLGPCDAEESVTASGYIEIVPSLEVALRHYLGNLMLCTSTTEEGQERPLIIVLYNPICVEPAKIKTVSKGIVVQQVKMRGSQPVSLATTPAIRYFVPEPLGSGS